jgi:phosphatidylglycerophosphate synthase
MHAVVLGDSPVRLWGLTPAERIQRQLRSQGVEPYRGSIDALAPDATLLLLRGDWLYDDRVIRGLIKAQRVLLAAEDAGATTPVAAHVASRYARQASNRLQGEGPAPAGDVADTVTAAQLAQGFEMGLRKLDRPYVLRVTAERREELEQLTFSGAYKGVTDCVTKWLWPAPARQVTRWCVRLGFSPNQVTAMSLVLVVLVLFLFAQGEYGWGLLAGWVMTFLDTVDGKLARVTVTSTPLGNVFDHGIDLIHPPLWYLAWGAGFAPVVTQVAGLGLPAIYAIIFAGYIGGRLCEGAFQLWVARFSIFTWRPFDSYFRLIVARRNPSMIMLTAGFCAGRPDLGLLAVAAWHAASLAILLVRLLQGAAVRLRGDTARSWLTEIGQTVDESALAVRVFTHAGAIPRQA